MSGILDSKTRIIDAFVTEEGRRQITEGKLKIDFAAFTDRSTFYEASEASGSSDASVRLYFEAGSTIADQVTFETDDSGKLINWTGGDLQFIDGVLIDASGAFVTSEFHSTSPRGFATLSNNLIASSTQNFANLQYIGTSDHYFGDQFSINMNQIAFDITDDSPLKATEVQNIDLDSIRPLFFDQRLAHTDRFTYMEPILKISGSDSLGNPSKETLAPLYPSSFDPTAPPSGYARLNGALTLGTLDALKVHLEEKPHKEIIFEQTSRNNNIVMQMFEVNGGELSLKKLDVIDFGSFVDNNGVSHRVFFAGKIFLDEISSPSYVNLFTLILDNEKI